MVGVFAYFYSPLVDHALKRTDYSRPHTHFHIADTTLSQLAQFHGRELLHDHADHDEHDDGFLCVLSIDALLSLLLAVFMVSDRTPTRQDSLVVPLGGTYLGITLVYLSPVAPPPTSV